MVVDNTQWLEEIGIDIWLPRMSCGYAKPAPIYSAFAFSQPQKNLEKSSIPKIVVNSQVTLKKSQTSLSPVLVPSSITVPEPAAKKPQKIISTTETCVEPSFRIHILIRALTSRWLLLAEASAVEAEFSDAEYEMIFNLQRALEPDAATQPIFHQSWLSWPPNIGFSSDEEAQQWFAPAQLKAALRGLLKNRSWNSYSHLLVLGDRLSQVLTEKNPADATIVVQSARKTLIAYHKISTLVQHPNYRKTLWDTLKPLR